MNSKERTPAEAHSPKSENQRPAFWRNSVYDEPTWISLAWIIVPALFAGIALGFVVG